MNSGKTSRRTLIGGAAAAVAAAAAVSAGVAVKQKSDRIRVRQTVGTDTGTSRAFQWEGTGTHVLELRRRGNSGNVRSYFAVEESYTVKDRIFHIQTVKVTDLEPESDYEYRVKGPLFSGTDWCGFRTSAEGRMKALVFPDSQSTDHYDTWEKLYRGALARVPDADFTAHMGDLVDVGARLWHWDDWFRAVADGMDRVPAAPVMGNHDTFDLDEKTRVAEPQVFLRSFPVPDNGSSSFPRWYYAFDAGPVHFIVLNSEWFEADILRPGLLDEMKSWLSEKGRVTEKPWKVILMHRDSFYYKIKGRNRADRLFSDEGEVLMPLAEAAGADLVLSAHLHTYRRHGHLKNFRKDGTGPLYIVTGVAGNIRYPDFWIDHPLDDAVAPQPETDNYLVLEADEKTLRVTAHQPDGTQFDEAVLEKKTV